ncbi:MAG: hypothetical protein V3U99_00625 [Alphaproteobacteria bacterium]
MVFDRLEKSHYLAALALAFVVHALFFAPAGFLTTDEFLYAAMTQRLVEAGSLLFSNGYLETPSAALRLLFLTPTAQGLTPQYPAGYAFLAAPFFMLGGVRGMIFLNTLGALGLLWATYRFAKILFKDENLALNAALILGLATFIGDYAFAVLPHMIASLCMALAACFAATSQRGETRTGVHAALAGLCIGIGVNIRVDVINIAPKLAAWLICSSGGAIGRICALGAGMVPGLAAASGLNYLKFGSFSPITYGHLGPARSTDLTAIAGYQEFLPLLVLGLLATVAFGFGRVRELFLGWRGFGILALGLVAVMAVPATSPIAMRMGKGLYVLLVDLQSYDFINRYSGHGIIAGGKWLLFAGGVKKALFESLPYAGFLVLPLTRIFQRRDRAAHVLLFLVPLAWFAFFAVNQWHGGQSNNMRYFTPMLPFLAVAAAAAWAQMAALDQGLSTPGPRAKLLFALIFAVIAAAAWFYTHVVALLFLIGVAKWLFFLGLAMALLILLSPSIKRLLPIAKGLFCVSLAVAFIGATFHDAAISATKRTWDVEARNDCRNIEADALVISHLPRRYYCHFMGDKGRTAIYLNGRESFDARLVDWHLERNRPVYTDKETAAFIKDDRRAQGYVIAPDPRTGGGLYRVERALDGKPQP